MTIDIRPVDDDIVSDDYDYDPSIEPKSAKAWLNLLEESEDAFEDWNHHCDLIDKQYASLERLSNMARDKEFGMFWANCEVIKPSIYARPPQPAVTPKFKDRRPVYQEASELAERACTVSFDIGGIDELMKLIRDDVALIDRGVAWCRYESGGDSYYGHEKVCYDFKNRRDFLHSISRNWREVTWVAAASYLTRSQARKRFRKHSGDEYQNADYRVDHESKEIGGADARERAKFWEIWSKGDRRVLWVAKGCEKILDEDDPHLDLREFYPCPKPAYGTVQRGSLVPVPDVLQYKDQLEEVNMLTGRIHALSDAIEAKGFYPAGGAEIADAIQQAVAIKTPGRLLVPISNWAAFGQTKDVIVWLPIDMIATTITALVALRKQVIEDIYQIMGLSDIMRGSTDPQETLGAQELKTEYGSVRIRDKQQELVRLARDLVEISLEIITEKFSQKTMIEMTQTQLPTMQMQQQAVGQLQQKMMGLQQQMIQAQQQQMQQPQQRPPPGQPDPQGQQAQQLQDQMMQVQTDLQKTQAKPTIEQVFKFLKDNRAKSFVLDIETDSTIQSNEQMEKQSRNEFVQVLGGLLTQMGQMIAADPKSGKFCGEVLKFATAPYRAGRSLDAAIDELVEVIEAKADQPKGDDPNTAMGKVQLQIEQMKQATAQQKNQQDLQIKQAELQMKDQHHQQELQLKAATEAGKLNASAGEDDAQLQVQNQKMMESREAHQANMMANQQKMAIEAQKAQTAAQQHQMKADDMVARQSERREAQQFKLTQRPI
jgi:hypothetical protein